ncbi:MAG: hypothetical protein ACRDQ1_09045 [Sciscionella sp.]
MLIRQTWEKSDVTVPAEPKDDPQADEDAKVKEIKRRSGAR